MLAARQSLGTSKRDVFRHLLAEDSETGSRFTQAELNSNANLIIVAGADTTSSTMARLFGQLAKQPEILEKLRQEIDAAFGPVEGGEECTVENVKNLSYLNAVVNEALRLLNPLPSGVQATSPPAGVEIEGIGHIPGNVQVQIPHLVIMTDERYFPKGEEFIPERWTDRPELVRDRRAYVPFGYGVHSCVGKQLALNEMRLTIAKVVRQFDISFGESYDEEKFSAEWQDYAVLKIGALYLKFVARLLK